MGAPTPVPRVRPRRLLRLLSQPTRDQALPQGRSPAGRVLRARRGVGVVLRGRGLFRNRRECALRVWALAVARPCLGELAVVEPEVEALPLQQLGVAALLDDL